MEEQQKQHLSVVNASGFPLQLAVAAHIRTGNSVWRPVITEHPWRHPETGREGYIDLILQNQIDPSQFMIVECKRQRGDVRWYFLDPRPKTSGIRYLYTTHEPRILDVGEGSFVPASPEAGFCALHGEDQGRRPTLERLADELLQAVEAFALEQLAIGPVPLFRYLPVVITNARLFLCSAEPTSISLATGELPEHTEFREVPFVRFRKTLWASSVTEPRNPTRVEQAHLERERTVFVVSSTGLSEFLSNAHFTR